MRKGMMKGSGKRGYHNIIGKDPMVHSQSAKGIKQAQKVPMVHKLSSNLSNSISQITDPIQTSYIVSRKNQQGLLDAFDRVGIGASVALGSGEHGLITIFPRNNIELSKSKKLLEKWFSQKKIERVTGIFQKDTKTIDILQGDSQ